MLCAVAYALGPADQIRSEYEWSGPAEGTAEVTVPLTLSAGVPEVLEARLPCIDGSIVSTADGGAGLALAIGDGQASVAASGEDLGVIPLSPGCVVGWSWIDGVWRLTVDGLVVAGGVVTPPLVHYLRVEGPATFEAGTWLRVTTLPHGSSPSVRQWLFGTLAIMAAAVTLGGVWQRIAPDYPLLPVREVGRLNWSAGGVVDGVVALIIVAWMVLGPSLYDDGWVVVRARQFPELGIFSTYYSTQAAELPFGYWLEWLQHWWLVPVNAPVWQRVPVALVSMATWVAVRLVLTGLRILRGSLSIWMAAGVYSLGMMAWMMTLRPEPVVALFATVVLMLIVRFGQSQDGRWLVLAGVIVALSATAHPSGLVAFAPVLAGWSWVWRFQKTKKATCVASGSAVMALVATTVVLFFLDSDLARKLASIRAFRHDGSGHELGPLDEVVRYRYMLEGLWSVPVRVAFVGLLLLIAIAYLTRANRDARDIWSLPARATIAALLLLSFTPSKWPWHFGTVVGLVTVALVVEFALLAREWHPGESLRVPAMVLALAMLTAWSWSRVGFWNIFDLLSLRWKPGGVEGFPFDLSHPLLWLSLSIGVLLLYDLIPRLRAGGPGRSVLLLTAISMSVFVSFPIGVFASDAAVTDGWSFGKQNLAALSLNAGCGRADYTAVPARGSVQPLDLVNSRLQSSADSIVEQSYPKTTGFEEGGWFSTDERPQAPLAEVSVMGSRPRGLESSAADSSMGAYRSPWYRFTKDVGIGLLLVGGYDGNSAALQFGVTVGDDIEHVDIVSAEVSGYGLDWLLVSVEAAPPNADVVRTLLRDETTGPGGWIAGSDPLGFRLELLANVLAADNTTALIHPDQALYYPCAEQPSIANGVVEYPMLVVGAPGSVFAPASELVRYVRFVSVGNDAAELSLSSWYLTGQVEASIVPMPLPRGEQALLGRR